MGDDKRSYLSTRGKYHFMPLNIDAIAGCNMQKVPNPSVIFNSSPIRELNPDLQHVRRKGYPLQQILWGEEC